MSSEIKTGCTGGKQPPTDDSAVLEFPGLDMPERLGEQWEWWFD